MSGGEQRAVRSNPHGKSQPADARPRNRALLLQALLADGAQSRADLARVSGLTPTTVSAVTADLLADGLVEEVGRKPSSSAGKPATLVAVDPDGRHIIALDLSDDDAIQAAVVDMAGKIVTRRAVPRNGEVGRAATRTIVRVAKEMVRRAERPVLGVGIATPGIVDDDGVVVTAAHVQWTDEPLAHNVAAAVGVPCHVTNDANAGVLAEYRSASNDGSSTNLLLVRVGGGVGAGIVIGGELFTGDHFAAGEIGHVVVDEGGALCRCGRTGCLEAVVSAPLLAQRLGGVTEAERHQFLERAGGHLGIALATLVAALNLSQIVLSGPLDLLDERFRTSAVDTIRARTFPAVGEHVTARFSALGDDGVLLGAASLVLRRELGVI